MKSRENGGFEELMRLKTKAARYNRRNRGKKKETSMDRTWKKVTIWFVRCGAP